MLKCEFFKRRFVRLIPENVNFLGFSLSNMSIRSSGLFYLVK